MCSRTAFLCGIVFALTIPYATAGTYSGGSGTAEDPYQIGTPDDILELSATPTDWSGHFLMIADVNMLGHTFDQAVIAPDMNKSGSGFQGMDFTGVFDGAGHRISNLAIQESFGVDYMGLFGRIGSGGQVLNLGLEGVNIQASGYSVGGLAGCNMGGSIAACNSTGTVASARYSYSVGGLVGDNNGSIADCYSTSTVAGDLRSYSIGGLVGDNSGSIADCYSTGAVVGAGYSYSVGGLVGDNGGSVSVCYSTGAVTGDRSVGGLVGFNDDGSITDCSSTGPVTGDYNVGGLLGHNTGSITACTSSGTVSGEDYGAGGLVGWNGHDGLITACYSSGAVTGDRKVAGLVGSNDGSVSVCYSTGAVTGGCEVGGLVGWNDDGSITSCYSTGTVTGDSKVGGLVGDNDGSITTCTSSGRVTGDTDVGGLVGDNGGSVSVCYSTGAVTGDSGVGGLVGLNEDGSVTACYSAGAVTGDTDVGGLVGLNDDGSIAACFWDVQTSGQLGNSGGIGLMTEQMQTMSNFQNAGWQGCGWVMDDGLDYPRLEWQGTPGVPIPGPLPVPLEGAGTAGDPYQIHTPGEFALLARHIAVLDKCIRLEADLDLAGVDFLPIGEIGPFTGRLDGAGHRILNLTIQDNSGAGNAGLFGQIEFPGEILNLGLEGVDVRASASYVGALAGQNSGSIIACYSTGTVTGGNSVGGLVGYNDDGLITACYSTGTVIGNKTVGGLMGGNEQGAVSACYSTGAVTGDSGVGGLVGGNGGSITACYSTGTVTGNATVGGLVGGTGFPWGSITACFWDVDASGQSTSDGGIGLTTEQMQQVATFLDAGWDDQGETANGTCDYWHLEDGRYPQLLWQVGSVPVPGGEGTAENPYLIHNSEDLGAVWFRPTAHYRLTSSLDLSEISWLAAPIPMFAGHFDGAGHTIKRLQIRGGGYLGLFGCINTSATVSGLSMEKADIRASASYYYSDSGALAGQNSGSLTACCSTGRVSGVYSIGGLVGVNQDGSITACFSACEVHNEGCAGGLVGYNDDGLITACYATGAVLGVTSPIAGLVGDNYYGSITACYSTGLVMGEGGTGGLIGSTHEGSVTACFWDKSTSKQSRSFGGSGLTTAAMQQIATFLDAGWDFVGEGENGSEDTWRMCVDGVDYPRLAWEFAQDGDFDCPDGVGIEDVWYLSGRWLGTTPATVGAADSTGDGVADLADLAILAAHWLAGP